MGKTRFLRAGLALLPLLLLAALALAGAVTAGSSAHYAVDWQALAGGGAPAVSVSGHAVLNGSLGQTAIGYSSAGHDALGAGFWYGAGQGVYPTYLPLVVRNF
jgi:hypothetical protein